MPDPFWTPKPGEAFLTDPNATTGLTNSQATPGPTNNEICERTGFRVPRGTLRTEWDGRKVRPESYEPRHPLDKVRIVSREESKGSPSPEPADQFAASTYIPTRVQFWPNRLVNANSGDFLSLVDAGTNPVANMPATYTSFTFAVRSRWRARGVAIQLAYVDGGTSSFAARFTLQTNVNGRLLCFGVLDALGSQTWTFAVGANTIARVNVAASPNNGDILALDTDYMVVATGDGATGQAALWHYDYAKALAWERQTGEKLSPQFWIRNSATTLLAPTAGMNMSDVRCASIGCANGDPLDVCSTGLVPSGFLFQQTALIAGVWSATSSAFADMSSNAVRSALLGSPGSWGLGSPQIWYEGSAADWATNKGNGGNFLYCAGDPAYTVPNAGLTDCKVDSLNPAGGYLD